MEKLGQLKRLEHLGITDTPVTDTDQYIEDMLAMQNIWLCKSKLISEQGIASLKALPRLNVHVMN